MKKTIFLIALLISSISFAQSNEGFNYKALLTNNGNPVANATAVSVKITLKQGSSVKWQETHTGVHTDANGIFSIKIGEGTRNAGPTSFKLVNWTNGMKLTVQVANGGGYTTLVNNEPFKFVPYAKKAETVGTLKKLAINTGTNSNANGLAIDGSIAGSSSLAYFRLGSANNGQSAVTIYLPSSPHANSYYIKGDSKFSIKSDGTMYIRGELHGKDTGDADMKAYVYGIVSSVGNIHSVQSSTGFTVTKVSTGKYKITFTDTTIDDKYLVVATTDGTQPRIATADYFTDYFYIRTYNTSGAHADARFHFVVYRK